MCSNGVQHNPSVFSDKELSPDNVGLRTLNVDYRPDGASWAALALPEFLKFSFESLCFNFGTEPTS